MRSLSFFLFLALSKVALAEPLPAFEGTLTQTGNGVSAKAHIAWQPPDTLLIETQRDDLNQTPAQTILARGDETLLYEPASKRTHRYTFNIAKNWWRGSNLGSGGPANFLFAGTPFPTDTKDGRYLQRDDVLFGGGGTDAYYAAIKTPARRYAPQITVTPTSRIEKNEKGKTILDAKITTDAGASTRTAVVTAGGDTTTFVYDIKGTTTPLVIPDIPNAVMEEVQLQAPSAYATNTASGLFNRGASLALNEDFPAAYGAFEAASRLAPTASAPVIANFELAMSVRDDERAAAALAKLEDLKLDPQEIQPRHARLDLMRRDYGSALLALQAASQAAPQDLGLRLTLADAQRTQGNIEGARALYLGILAETSPQIATQASAAQTYALAAMPGEFPALLTAVPIQTQAQLLARSLIQLRNGKTPDTASFASNDLQTALALGYERAGRDDDAQKAWQALETAGNDALKNRARAHQMTLAAKRGDVSASIGYWHAWDASLSTSPEHNAARNAFFDAWQKAFRSDALKSALSNRSASAGATEDDLRLFLEYQARFGNDDDVTAAIENGLNRFPNSAFWMGQRAENRVALANQTHSNDAGMTRREQLFGEAMQLLDKAIAAAPDEPFYNYQKALAAVQRGSKTGAVIDAGTASRNRAFAKKETETLLANYPGDPDALVSAALQNLTLEGEANAKEAVRLATLALDTAPGDGDRHTLIWAARQALATAYRRLKQSNLAAAQWEILLLEARSPGEQSALANSYIGLFENAGDSAGAAHLLSKLAHESWGYSGARAALEATSMRMAASPLGPAVVTALSGADDGSSALAMATLTQKQLEMAQRALTAPDAPPAADANLNRATRDLGVALGKLKPIASGPDKVLAARAAAYLAETANLPADERLGLLRHALEIEPRDSALRFALMGALDGDDAKKERDLAGQILDMDPETRRQLASEIRLEGDVPLALKIGEEALAAATRAPEVDANTFQRLAFAVAKINFVGNQPTRALDLYNGLSLTQWNNIDRAAAMMALSRNYKDAGKDAEAAQTKAKVTALGLDATAIEAAANFVDDTEN